MTYREVAKLPKSYIFIIVVDPSNVRPYSSGLQWCTVQTTLVELPEHFGIPFYGVYRPLGGSVCDFVNLEPSL